MKNTIKKNNDGYLVQPLNKLKISDKWKKPVDDFLVLITKLGNNNIHSIYLRGSVAIGNEIPNVSDLDFYIITRKPINEFDIKIIRELCDNLNKKYSFITKYDINYFTSKDIMTIPERFLLKLTSFCIYGEDIKKKIENPKLGKDIWLSISALESDLNKLRVEIANGFYNETNTKQTCIWLTKKIIRSAFELISEKESEYSRDLSFCVDCFTKYYPHKNAEINNVLNLFLNPTDKIEDLEIIIDGIGTWLVMEHKTLSR